MQIELSAELININCNQLKFNTKTLHAKHSNCCKFNNQSQKTLTKVMYFAHLLPLLNKFSKKTCRKILHLIKNILSLHPLTETMRLWRNW